MMQLVILIYALNGQPLGMADAHAVWADPALVQTELAVSVVDGADCLAAMHRLWSNDVDAACVHAD